MSEQNRRGQTPLLLASEAGQTAVVQLLLQSGAGVRRINPPPVHPAPGRRSCLLAAHRGHVPMWQLHLCDSSNRSALELALERHHLETLAMLLHQACVRVARVAQPHT